MKKNWSKPQFKDLSIKFTEFGEAQYVQCHSGSTGIVNDAPCGRKPMYVCNPCSCRVYCRCRFVGN